MAQTKPSPKAIDSTSDFPHQPGYTEDLSDFPDQPKESLSARIKRNIVSGIDKVFTPPDFVKRFYERQREYQRQFGDTPLVDPFTGAIRPDVQISPEARMGFLDAVESISTPGDVALLAGTGGVGQLAKLGRGAARVASGLLATRGAARLSEAETPGDVVVGGLEAGLGALGVKYPVTWGSSRPKTSTQPKLTSSEPRARFYAGPGGIEDVGVEPIDNLAKESIANLPRPNLSKSRTRTVAKAKSTTESPIRLEDITPAHSRTPEGKLKVELEPEAMITDIVNLYQGDTARVAAKELIQNSIDAVRGLGGNGEIKVSYDEVNGILTVSDNGIGMLPKTVETAYMNLKHPGKDPTNDIGGFGLAKAIIHLKGESNSVVTVAIDPTTGKKIKTTFSGTPEDYLAGRVQDKVEIVPDNTPTGTSVSIKLKPDDILERYKVYGYIRDLSEHSIARPNIKGILGEVYQFRDNTAAHRDIGPGTLITPGAEVRLSLGPNHKITNSNVTSLIVSNRGMYQFDTNVIVPGALEVPNEIFADIKALVKTSDPNYPFTPSREAIKNKLKSDILNFIDQHLAKDMNANRLKRTQALYDGITGINVPSSLREVGLFDPGSRLTPDEYQFFVNSPIIKDLASAIDDTIDTILKNAGISEWSNKLRKVGLILSQENHYGIHIPDPKSVGTPDSASAILINPFSALLKYDNLDEAVSAMVVTMNHEVAHIGDDLYIPASFDPKEFKDPRIGKYVNSLLNEIFEQGGVNFSHGVSFIKKLAYVFSKFPIEEVARAEARIKRILSDPITGEISPDTERLLQIYQESRRRPEVIKDYLTATGVDQSAKSRGGKGSTGGAEGTRGGDPRAAINKLVTALSEVRKLRANQDSMLRRQRFERFREFSETFKGTRRSAAAALSRMRGEYDKLVMEELNMSQREIETLFFTIKQANVTEPEKVRAVSALFKMLNGEYTLPANEIQLLDEIFGGGVGEQLVMLGSGLGAVRINLAKTANTMKAMMSSFDVSASLRQGGALIHRPEWRKAYVDMFKYLGNKEYFKSAMSELESSPYYLLGRESGLFVAKPGTLHDAEERFLNSYVGVIPVARGAVGASERAYVGFLNKLRADLFKNLIIEAKAAGIEPYEVVERVGRDGELHKYIEPTQVAKNIAKYINVSTGRGGLGKLGKISNELNVILWSPRLLTSRLTMLNPKYYTDLDPFTRKQALKSAMSVAGMWLTMSTAASLTGYGVVRGLPWGGRDLEDKDILSSDFMKIRTPSDKVIDPGIGFQQIIVALARFIAGSNEVNRQSRLSIASNFMVNKLSPVTGLAYDLLTAREFNPRPRRNVDRTLLGQALVGGSAEDERLLGPYIDRFGNRKTISEEVIRRFIPIFVQDLEDLIQTDTEWAEAIGLSLSALHGVGVQDYPERQRRSIRAVRTPTVRRPVVRRN